MGPRVRGDDEEITRTTLPLQPHAQHHDRGGRTRSRLVGIQDIPPHRALDPDVTAELVDQVAGDRIETVEPRVALVGRGTEGELAYRGEPAAEIVIDFESVAVGQHAGNA